MASLFGVPDVVWSGVIASLITFSGVWLSNRDNTKRQQNQLLHDAEQKATQRKADMRQDVYLEFAEQQAAAASYIGGMATRDIRTVNPSEGIQGFIEAAAKVQLICSAETGDAVAKMVAAKMKLFMRAMVQAFPAQTLIAEIEIADEAYKDAQAEIRRIRSSMVALFEEGRADSPTLATLGRSLEGQTQLAKLHADKRAELHNKRNHLLTNYLQFIVSEMMPVIDETAPALIAVRRELELDGDVHDIEYQIRKRSNMMKEQVTAATQEFLEAAERQVAGTATK
ncbi:hypothetical protein [Burkholderia sp. Ac-20365]|uniref:hypothetical protein n=1 Tax=Burkholderia sp. Ac-20365 TaxID=2703897 RepID=UPI00197C8C1C|nr:hypothetical protein [Burkholderia sp. Ac-20365]MBN3763398.1 hypothetical protein [Burkholderia sp. Ac-20365]